MNEHEVVSVEEGIKLARSLLSQHAPSTKFFWRIAVQHTNTKLQIVKRKKSVVWRVETNTCGETGTSKWRKLLHLKNKKKIIVNKEYYAKECVRLAICILKKFAESNVESLHDVFTAYAKELITKHFLITNFNRCLKVLRYSNNPKAIDANTNNASIAAIAREGGTVAVVQAAAMWAFMCDIGAVIEKEYDEKEIDKKELLNEGSKLA